MSLYANKTEAAKALGISRATIGRMIPGIEREIKAGRYSRYAIADGLINLAVVLDYRKYRNLLEDKNVRKYVPAFDPIEAARMLGEEGGVPRREVQQDEATQKRTPV